MRPWMIILESCSNIPSDRWLPSQISTTEIDTTVSGAVAAGVVILAVEAILRLLVKWPVELLVLTLLRRQKCPVACRRNAQETLMLISDIHQKC